MATAKESSDYPGAEPFLPDRRTAPALAKAVRSCRGCDLYRDATQAVFGSGAKDPSLVLVGEQPGDVEDREGVAFVGPAGRLLDKALDAAGIDPAVTYRTNAVKHFRFGDVRGKRRIHKKPAQWQVTACRPWLLAELSALEPEGIVVLGATAARTLLGSAFRLTDERGTLIEYDGEHADWILATTHPSSVLRSPDRDKDFDALVADLGVAGGHLSRTG
jgi:uracil-DNA glycosylase